MKSKNNIYIFFIILAILFWNPLSFYLIYKETPIYQFSFVGLFFIINFIANISFVFLLKKNVLSTKTKNIIFSLSITSIIISLIILSNILIGNGIKNKEQANSKLNGLIFEPNTSAHYKTIEFDFMANINDLGLRDKKIDVDKGNKFRILCFGDSWTYGWGVDVENSWPKKLESYLHSKGYLNVEVINCGKGGQYTTVYKKYMEKTVPLLKPDLVLVGVLQGEDLAQLFINKELSSNDTIDKSIISFWNKMNLVLKYSIGNILQKLRFNKTIEVKSNWQSSAKNMIKKFSPLQKLRFKTLDDTIQKLFISGDLSTNSLDYYINFPDLLSIFNDPSHPATKYAIKEMDIDIKEMKKICAKNNCGFVFVNLPTNILTGHKVIRTPSDILNPFFMSNNKIDSIYNSIANNNNVPYIEITKHFIDLKNKTGYFYIYDGHPNSKGYEEIAYYIGQSLIEKKLLKTNH